MWGRPPSPVQAERKLGIFVYPEQSLSSIQSQENQ
jgi:hypothetical protein